MSRASYVLPKLATLALSSLLAAAGCGGAQKPHEQAKARAVELDASRLHVQTTSAPVIDLRVVFEAGSVDDPSGREGLTHVTVASMLEGKAGGVSYAERERLLYPMAAEISGHVERQQVVFSARVHRDHLSAFYPLFRDLLLRPEFAAADVERVRTRALSALTQDLRGADDETLGKELLQSMIFEAHPYGRPDLGTERGLSNIELGAARAQWARVLCAARVQVAVSGPVDASFVERMRADFGGLSSADCEAPATLPIPREISARRLWIVDKPEAASVAISMGVPIAVTRSHPDYAALTLATAYFGQHRTFAGQLMQKLREDRGLNYGDYAYAEHFVQDGSTRFPLPNVARRTQYFSIWLRPVPVEKAQFALRMALRELDLFVQNGLSQADFERMQRFVDRYYALFAQTEQQRLGNLLDDVFYGVKGPHLDVLRAQVRALTRDQVNAAIKRHLHPQRLQIALVAPNASQLADALAKGDPSPITYSSEKPAEILDEDKLIAVYPFGLTREQITLVPVARVFY